MCRIYLRFTHECAPVFRLPGWGWVHHGALYRCRNTSSRRTCYQIHAPAQRTIKGLIFSIFVRLWGTLSGTIP